MKKLFTLIALCLGISSGAWADAGDVTTNVNIDFSNPINEGVVSGAKGSMTIGTGSGAAARIEGGWLRQGDVTNTVTILESERAGSRDVVNVKCKMAWGNKNGMGSKIELKDADGEVVFSLSHCRWGSSSNNANINLGGLVGSAYNNAPILDRYTLFDITIDYANKTITSKVSCTNPKASNTFVATLTNTNPIATFSTAGFNVGGNTDRADAFDDLIITTTEGDYAAATAEYIVKYVDNEGIELKEPSSARVGDVASTPILLATDKNAIYTGDGKKFVYASDDASSTPIANDNSTVVTITFTEVAKYNYTIKAEDANHNDIKTLASGATFTDEPVNMYIPLQLFKGGKLYGISGENSWRSITITSNNQVETITYPNVLDNVVAFVEGEAATGAAECTPTGNLQLASGGHMGRGSNLPIGTISAPGKYQVIFHYINTNGSAHPVTVNVDDNALPEISANASSRNNYSSEVFTVIDPSNITFSVGGSSTSGVDYIYIVKTGKATTTVAIDPEIGYATFYDSTHAVELPAGVTAYIFTEIDEDPYSYDPVFGLMEYGEAQSTLAGETFEGVIPAGEAVVLEGTANAELTYSTTDIAPLDGVNYLMGYDEAHDTEVNPYMNGFYSVFYYYGLSLNAAEETNSIGFYWMNETGAPFNSGAHKAYLCFPDFNSASGGAGGFAPSRFLFKQGEATAIKTVNTTVNRGMMFNLAGQRVNNNAKGIVVVNGKKVLNK